MGLLVAHHAQIAFGSIVIVFIHTLANSAEDFRDWDTALHFRMGLLEHF
jgi:hypothetical protein